jgi:hypothetical protein
LNNFAEPSDFDFKCFLLTDGGIPPSPPNSPPLTPRSEPEENYEEEENSQSESKDNHLQLALYNPQNMVGANENQNPPPC